MVSAWSRVFSTRWSPLRRGGWMHTIRPFSSSSSSSSVAAATIRRIPLSESLPIETHAPVSVLSSSSACASSVETKRESRWEEEEECTRVSTLANGIRIITNRGQDSASAVGFFLNVGSKNEVDGYRGCTYLLHRLALSNSAASMRHDLLSHLENMGSKIISFSSREQFFVSAETLPQFIPECLDILSDMILFDEFRDADIQSEVEKIYFHYDEIFKNSQELCSILGHEAAYGYRSGMSHAEIPHPEDAFAISAAKLREFLHAIRVGQDFVVVGTGISDHDEFVRLISDRLESIPPSHSSDSPRCLTRECETYVGGEWFPQESTWRNIPVLEEKSNILMLFKGFPSDHPDAYSQQVLSFILGGGDSFSSGGPGKGMYTRLFLNVLNQHHWIDSAMAFSSCYSNSGLFGIFASSNSKHVLDCARYIAFELLRLASSHEVLVSNEELERAKKRLRSSYLLLLEDRQHLIEQLSLQMFVFGKIQSVREVLQKLDDVTSEDVRRVAQKMIFESPPTMVVLGNAEKGPSYNSLVQFFQKQ